MQTYIPHYTLLRQLDAGSMGEVWLAEHASNGRRAAVKFLRSEAIGDTGDLSAADIRNLFLRECQVLASFDHPNIVRIYDNARVGDTPYMVMELLSGGTLAERIRRSPVSVGESIGLVVQVANALETVHTNKIIHRDLKPANIMLRDEVTPVLTDFGVARLLQPGIGTVFGKLLVGTLSYMSPEQFLGQPASVATDLYALGVVFHELLTGRVPYVRTLAQSMSGAARQPAPPLPKEWSSLQPVLDRLLAEDPEQRYRSASQFALSLRQTFVADPNLSHLISYSGLSAAWVERLHSLGFAVIKPGHAYSPPPPLAAAPAPVLPAPAAMTAPAATPEVHVAHTPLNPPPRRHVKTAVVLIVALALVGALGAALSLWRRPADQRSTTFQDTLKSGGQGPEMVRIGGGTVRIGSDNSPISKPVREVTLPDFAVARTEVTVGQFKAFVSSSGYQTDAERNVTQSGCFTVRPRASGFGHQEGASWRNPGFEQSDAHPVVCVSKSDAEAYAAWLAAETNAPYRLPSEAQAEFLIRGKSTASAIANVAICAYANVAISPKQRCSSAIGTVPAGSLKQDSFGLTDIVGNASEWTADCWSPSYAGAPADGAARVDGDCERGVLRGGGWGGMKQDPAERVMSRRTDRTFETGFRVVRDPN